MVRSYNVVCFMIGMSKCNIIVIDAHYCEMVWVLKFGSLMLL